MSFDLDRREFLAAMAAVTATSFLPACVHASVRQAQEQSPAPGLSERMEFGVSGLHRDLLSEMTFTDHVTVPPLELRILVPNPS
jgi:hypothetical protein